jgi:hypothetical protein
MGQMSNRSSNPGLRVLGSFRNFAQRQEAVGSFRISLASALSETGLAACVVFFIVALVFARFDAANPFAVR